MASPTIALCLIMKNERKNLPRLFESVAGCFDEIHVVDTGSTDGSQDWVKNEGEKTALTEVYLHYFKWVNSFCKARNYAFSHANTDYIMWLDLDDCLSDREAFIQWKNHAMEFADCFLLLCDATRRAGFTSEQLLEAAWKKLEICKGRKWSKAGPNEAVEHIHQ